MLPEFLLEETTIREAGDGPVMNLSGNTSGALLVTLGITRIIEQESLDVSIWGSADGTEWGTKPVIAFPQKFYCGTYQIVLDLSQRPEVRYLRARWQANRWGKGDAKPVFGAYLFVQAMAAEPAAV
ncbi:MAG TPA: hypothetical protein VMU19_06555 [Bryobacteraceae bacterium]|nr:hypothetical protein [Bryobacteraceae bacterium]